MSGGRGEGGREREREREREKRRQPSPPSSLRRYSYILIIDKYDLKQVTYMQV